jgi:LysR family nitrogen assimilation transcriptional regulator
MRPVCNPPLSTRLFLATSSMRPTTRTQQTTLALIRQTLAAALEPAAALTLTKG